ncbi:hypothetical protein HaLaN_10044, partial [Haematococcus lacustris]
IQGSAEPVLDLSQSYIVQTFLGGNTNNLTGSLYGQSGRLVDRFGNLLHQPSFNAQMLVGGGRPM